MNTKIISAALVTLTAVTGMTAQNTAPRVNGAIDEVRTLLAPDKRQTIYEITPIYGPDSTVALTGKVSERNVHDALVQRLKADGVEFVDLVNVLPDTLWATPRLSAVHLRMKPGHENEMASQAIMGHPMRILEKQGGWYRVQTPEGYISWVISSSIEPMSQTRMEQWRGAPRVVVTAPWQTRVWADARTTDPRQVVSDVVNGNILEGKYAKGKKRIAVTLPDGRQGWIDTADVTPIEQWADQKFDAAKILDMAYSMEGTPYLWGGTSAKSLDCSGLAKVSYLANGIILLRDASQQALTGQRIEAADWRQCQPGDLLFFGNAKTGKVTHVAIYDRDGNYIHSSGRVKRNSVDPASESYLTTPFLHAARINGSEGTTGITRAIDHPWYFNK